MPPLGLAGHPDHDALLAAVIADPDADLPRLVYADYLEEAGDEADAARAEFIRLQCGIAERERTERVAEGDPDWERAAELADDYGGEWRRRMLAFGGVEWGFGGRGDWFAAWRGFPQACAVAPATLGQIRQAPAPLDCVGLSGGVFGHLPRTPVLARLRVVRLALTFGGYGPPAPPQRAGMLGRVLRHGEVSAWCGLVLTGAGDEAFDPVATCPRLDSLEWLRLLVPAGTAPNLGLFPRLFDSPSPPRLAWVEVRTHAGELLAHRAVER